MTISVVIPAFHAESTIPKTLDSLCRQTVKPFEVIVVDDASADKTYDISNTYTGRLPLKILRSPENRGPGWARHLGAKVAKGDVLAFLDSDCVAPENWLEFIYQFLMENPYAGGVCGRYSHVARTGMSAFEWVSYFEETIVFEYFRDNPSAAVAMGGNSAYRRKIWKERSGRELLVFKNEAGGEDSLIHGEIKSVVAVPYCHELEVVHEPAARRKYIRKSFSRGKSAALGILNRVNTSSLPLLKWLELWSAAFASYSLWLAIASLIVVPLLPVANAWVVAGVLFAAGIALNLLFGRAYIQKARGAKLSISMMIKIQFITSLRTLLWMAGGLAGTSKFFRDKAAFALKLIASVAHFWIPNRISKLFFFITSRCNARCSFCFNLDNVEAGGTRKEGELSLDEISALTLQLGRMPYLNISGGEPFLRKDLPQIIQAFHNNAQTMWVSIPTNGSLTEKIRESVVEILGLCPQLSLKIFISIDELFEKHDDLRKLKDCFKNIENTVRELGKLKPFYKNLHVHVTTVLAGENLAATERISPHIESIAGYEDHIYLLARERGLKMTPYSQDVLKQYARLLEQEVERKKSHGTWVSRLMSNYLERVNKSAIRELFAMNTGRSVYRECYSSRKFVTLYDNGEVSPCEVLSPFEFGNIRDVGYDLPRLLRQEHVRDFVRDEIVAKKCQCDWSCSYAMNKLYSPLGTPVQRTPVTPNSPSQPHPSLS